MAGRIGLELTQTHFVAQPGGVGATAPLVIRNAGTLVDQLSVQVQGVDPGWVSVSPASINLFPGGQAELQVSVNAPVDAPAGTIPFRLVATSQADPTASVTLDASLEVAELGTMTLALVPLRQYAFRRATYTLQLGNRGNANRLVQLAASDPDAALRFELPTDQVLVRPGQESVVPLRVRPRKTTWRGGEHSLFFSVSAQPAQDPLASPLAHANGELVCRSLAGALVAWPLALRRAALIGLPLLLAALIGLFFLGQAGQQLPVEPTGPGTPTSGPIAAGGTPTPGPNGGSGPAPTTVSPLTSRTPVAAAGAPPTIARFGLQLPADEAPAFLPLDWDVRGANTTQLSRSPNGTGPSRGEADIEAADYTLTAANDDGTTSQTIRVYVLRPPVITDFEASAVQVGDTVTLTWRADRANRVYLNDQLLDGSEGTRQMPADPNAPYVLRAENVVGQDIKALELTVGPPPVPTQQPTLEPTVAPDVLVTPSPIPNTNQTPPVVLVETPVVTPVPPDEPPTVTPIVPPVSDTPVVVDVTDVPTVVTTEVVPPTVVTPGPVVTAVPGCSAKFQPLNFTATTNGNTVDLKWGTSGGCEPYNGQIDAVYTYNGSNKSFAASSLTGTGTDNPPSGGCGSPNQINYKLTLKDTNGLTTSATANASVQHDCTSTNPPVTVVVPPGAPVINAARTPPANSAGWNNTDVTVTFTCSEGTSGVTISSCGPSPQVVSTEGQNQTVTGTVLDSRSATATATVSPINIDKTAPTTTAKSSPTTVTPDGAEVAQPAIAVTLSAVDQPGLSGVKSITFSAKPTTAGAPGQTIPATTVNGASAVVQILAGGQTTLTFAATDVAGNVEAPKTIPLTLDATAPTTTATQNPAPNGPNGWVNLFAFGRGADLVEVVKLTATDAGGSGVKSITFSAQPGCAGCPGSTVSTTVVNAATTSINLNAGITTIIFSATDNAGNVETPKSLTVRVDTTPPVLTTPPSVPAATRGATARVTYDATATDALSSNPAFGFAGPTVTCDHPSGSSFSIGTTLVTCTAVDGAGNRISNAFNVVVTLLGPA